MNTATDIRGFIGELLRRRGDTNPFEDSESLLQSGRLQSIDATEIVIFLESHYGIDFSDIGFDQDLIGSVERIQQLLRDNMG